MSPIGRVFVVLNLVLAGAFVGFAGTYLKNHTNWKAQHDALETKSRAAETELKAALANKEADLGTARRELQAIDQKAKHDKADLDDKINENQRLNQKLASLDADIKAMKGDYATVASKVETATEDAKKTLQLAMTADEEKHKALNLKTEADSKLAEANAKIAALETKLAEANSEVQKRDQTIGEQKTFLSAWQLKYPGGILTAQPDVEGRISNVSGRLVTLEITDKKGELQKGNMLAIFNGNTYKGEMQVDSVEGNFAFGKITTPVDGRAVSVGDRASTNLGR